MGQLSVLADINELLGNLKQKRNVDVSKNLWSKRTNKDTGRIVDYVNQGIKYIHSRVPFTPHPSQHVLCSL